MAEIYNDSKSHNWYKLTNYLSIEKQENNSNPKTNILNQQSEL